jgi:RNA polymerase sigma-70 factor (ECF subfamily)
MTPRGSAADVLARLRAGEEEAATRLFRRFAHRLIGLARQHLDTRIRAKEDPEDVVQSVYKSFFVRLEKDQFEIASWDDLWSLLTVITLRKCSDRRDYFRAQRRDAACEVPADAGDSSSANWGIAIDREPTPDEAAVLSETVEQVLRGLDSDDRAVIEMSLQGYSTQEISRQLGRTERTVQRLRQRVKQRLERLGQE